MSCKSIAVMGNVDAGVSSFLGQLIDKYANPLPYASVFDVCTAKGIKAPNKIAEKYKYPFIITSDSNSKQVVQFFDLYSNLRANVAVQPYHVAVLILDASLGGFESGLSKDSVLRSALLPFAKLVGITDVIVLINKMDTIKSMSVQERYDEIVQEMPLIGKRYGVQFKHFIPMSLFYSMDTFPVPGYTGPSFANVLQDLSQVDAALALDKRVKVAVHQKSETNDNMIIARVLHGQVRIGDHLCSSDTVYMVHQMLDTHFDNTAIPIAYPFMQIKLQLHPQPPQNSLVMLCNLQNPPLLYRHCTIKIHANALIRNGTYSAHVDSIITAHLHILHLECKFGLRNTVEQNPQQLRKETGICQVEFLGKPMFVDEYTIVTCGRSCAILGRICSAAMPISLPFSIGMTRDVQSMVKQFLLDVHNLQRYTDVIMILNNGM